MVKPTISRIGLDYSISRVTVYRVIRIRGGKDENLDVRDGNRRKLELTLTNSTGIRAPSSSLFLVSISFPSLYRAC